MFSKLFLAVLLLGGVNATFAPPPSNYAFYLPTDGVIANIRSGDLGTSYNGLAHMVSGALRVCRSSVFKCNISSPLERAYLLRLSQTGTKRRLLQEGTEVRGNVSILQVMELLKRQKEEMMAQFEVEESKLQRALVSKTQDLTSKTS
jgi:hypothetical protein